MLEKSLAIERLKISFSRKLASYIANCYFCEQMDHSINHIVKEVEY